MMIRRQAHSPPRASTSSAVDTFSSASTSGALTSTHSHIIPTIEEPSSFDEEAPSDDDEHSFSLPSTPSNFTPKDAVAEYLGTNAWLPSSVRRLVTPPHAPGHVNLGLDNAYYKCPPPACSVCNKQKRNTGDLTRHILSHIVWGDKRVNQCRSCPVSYARKDALTRHLRHNPGHRGQYDALCPEVC